MKTTNFLLASLIAIGASWSPLSAAPIYHNVSENTAYFGWFDQYSLGTTSSTIGPEACVPTSSTNVLTYLQNLAPAYFGTALTGTTYATWSAADTTLASAAYMDTSPVSGTWYNHLPYGLNKYIKEDRLFTAVQFAGQFPADYWAAAPYDKPAYITDGDPTSTFLLNSLSANQATLISILYSGGGGHELAVTGLNWTDANADGIIQFSENATLSFVDPLDPCTVYTGGQPDTGPGNSVKITQGHLWNASDLITGKLKLDYNQYAGSLPYDSSSYAMTGAATIDTAFSIAVPEPGSLVLLAQAGFWVFILRRGNCRLQTGW